MMLKTEGSIRVFDLFRRNTIWFEGATPLPISWSTEEGFRPLAPLSAAPAPYAWMIS